jgi:hypothetical protein
VGLPVANSTVAAPERTTNAGRHLPHSDFETAELVDGVCPRGRLATDGLFGRHRLVLEVDRRGVHDGVGFHATSMRGREAHYESCAVVEKV